MIEVMYPQNRTWQTKTTREGYSFQGTRAEGRWYYRYHLSFCGGQEQAIRHMSCYHSDRPHYLVEQFGSGLAMILIPIDNVID